MCLCLCVCKCVCVCVIGVILFCTIVFEGLHSDELPTEIACTDSSKRGIVSLHGHTSMINSNVPTPPSPHTHTHTHKHTQTHTQTNKCILTIQGSVCCAFLCGKQ